MLLAQQNIVDFALVEQTLNEAIQLHKTLLRQFCARQS